MKMEIELTDDQARKVETLKENGIEVGEAIDMLFEMNNTFIEDRIIRAQEAKAELEEKISEIDEELSLFNKLKDGSLDTSQKQKIVEKEYGTIDKTYDESVQDAKHKFKWTRLI
jgi:hypothetical protein